MEIHLIQPRELFGPPERQEELRECWRRSDGIFDSYALLAGRPTFEEMFAFCLPTAINVIANSDIYFDSSIRAAAPAELECFALSRWNVDGHGLASPYFEKDSQDAWIFRGIPPAINASFTMGTPGCDNALAFKLKEAGYHLSNPCRTIRAYHLHNVQWRGYLEDPTGKGRGGRKIDSVPGPYAFVHPEAQ